VTYSLPLNEYRTLKIFANSLVLKRELNTTGRAAMEEIPCSRERISSYLLNTVQWHNIYWKAFRECKLTSGRPPSWILSKVIFHDCWINPNFSEYILNHGWGITVLLTFCTVFNFDLELSKCNSESWHRCWTKFHAHRTCRTNEGTNQQTRPIIHNTSWRRWTYNASSRKRAWNLSK